MDSRIELPFSTLVWQPRPTSWLVTVVCKATFKLEPGELSLSPHQDPVTRDESFWDDDPARSVSLPSDLVPSKPKADVFLTGSAFAPKGRPARSLTARLSIDSIDKSLEIITDRSVGSDGTVYQGPRFARMPLVYERAAGGPGTSNPVGVRRESRDTYGRAPLPNITPAGKGDDMTGPIESVGFGPIAAGWPQRRDKAGYHAASFNGGAWWSSPLPDGFDLAYFNVAPPDQQLEAIAEDATLLLEGLSAEHASLRAKLPGLRPLVTVERRGGKERPAMRPDTLAIDTDRAVVALTWRGHFQVETRQEAYRVSVEVERPRHSWQTVSAPLPQTRLDALANDDAGPPTAVQRSVEVAPRPGTLIGSAAQNSAALPFQGIARASERRASMEALPFAPAAAGAIAIPPSPPSNSGRAPYAAASAAAQPPTYPPPPTGASYASPAIEPWLPPTPAALIPPPPVVAPVAAAAVTATSASNAAADPSGRAAAETAPKRVEGDVLHLLWANPDAAARIRRKPEWKKVLAEHDQARFDPDIDGAAPADPDQAEAQREVNQVLSRGTPSREDGIDHALNDAIRADGRFAPQLILLLGELRFDFDEIETLRATLAAATPFATSDEELKKKIDEGARFLSTPGVVAAPDVTRSMTTRVREAFAAAKRSVADNYLDDQTERVLLERRAFQTLPLFGAPHLRCLFFFAGSDVGIPTYLPEPLKKKLPLFRRIRARMLVEAHFQADQYETHPAALKPVAVARIVR